MSKEADIRYVPAMSHEKWLATTCKIELPRDKAVALKVIQNMIDVVYKDNRPKANEQIS